MEEEKEEEKEEEVEEEDETHNYNSVFRSNADELYSLAKAIFAVYEGEGES